MLLILTYKNGDFVQIPHVQRITKAGNILVTNTYGNDAVTHRNVSTFTVEDETISLLE